jgi:sulfhydrogenase subunit alpha
MSKTITLNHITKIEGHAKLNLKIDNGKITTCELSATEGARYFEGIVKGRKYYAAHEMTSRICGICSCAHVVAALTAVEDALGLTISEQSCRLRVLLTLAERIRSHATHLYFLALPDYLGYESALSMATEYKPQLQAALRLMKMGNGIVKLLGGRDLHPVSAGVGGWLKLPKQEEMEETGKELLKVKKDAIATVKLFADLKQPEFESDAEWFSLVDPNEYAVLKGKFASGKCSFEKHEYRKFIKEYHQSYSTANFIVKEDHRYFVSALARLNNNHRQLSKDAQKALKETGLKPPSKNPYHNNLAQAIELIHCIDHAMEICKREIKQEEMPEITPRAGRGVGVIEVPRGTLWHEYTLDEKGIIIYANIITPTTQNLFAIQEDIRKIMPSLLEKKKEEIVLNIEKLIRNYDPCFSCAAHFLEVKWL